jgi:hypothetical protein
MKLIFSLLKGLAIFFSALLFTSCLDTHEEIWINSDASGAARIQIAIPLAATALHGGEASLRKMIEEYLNSTPAFSSYALDTSTEEDRLKIDLAITFDNALDLQTATSEAALEKLPTGTAKMIGHSEVEFQGLSLAFSRQVELSKAIPGALFFPASQLEGHSLTTIIHLPKAASSHNATSTNNDGRTLIWETPLETAFRKPVETNFTMPLPIPWMSIGLIALLLLILVAALIYYLRRRKSKQIAA